MLELGHVASLHVAVRRIYLQLALLPVTGMLCKFHNVCLNVSS